MVSSDPLPISNTDNDLQPGNDDSADAPSGFILKLFQMVTGAPDEIISVSSIVLRMVPFCTGIIRLVTPYTCVSSFERFR